MAKKIRSDDCSEEELRSVTLTCHPGMRDALDPLRWFWGIFEELPCAYGWEKGGRCSEDPATDIHSPLNLRTKCAPCQVRVAMRKLKEQQDW